GDELQEHHQRRQEFDETIGAKRQKYGAACAPWRKKSKGALHHHPDQREHLQAHDLSSHLRRGAAAGTALKQCSISHFFLTAHSTNSHRHFYLDLTHPVYSRIVSQPVNPTKLADESKFVPIGGQIPRSGRPKLPHESPNRLMIIERPVPTASEFDPCLEGDHAGRVVAAQAYSGQSSRRRGGGSECSKPRLRRRFPRNPSQNHAGEGEIRMIKHIEKLRFQAEFGALGQGEPLGKVEITPNEAGLAQGVAAEVSKLAGRRVISAHASAGAGVDGGGKGIRIEPLGGAGLRYTGNGFVLIQGHARGLPGELRPTALHNAISISGVRRAQDGERNPAVPKCGSGNLPPVHRV